MWTRQELKHKGKEAFYKSYWKFVLVTLVLGMVTGGAASLGSSFGSSVSNIGNIISNSSNRGGVTVEEDMDELDRDLDELGANLDELDEKLDEIGDNIDENIDERFDGIGDGLNLEFNDHNITIGDGKVSAGEAAGAAIAVAVVVAILVFSFICLIVGIIGIAVDIFVYNPLEYGCTKFFRKSQNENTSLATMFHGFKDGYGKIVKVLFFRDLFIFLWSLLFVIPGIVKAYEYRMVPYLLSENPNMTKDEALKASSRMMSGQKWRAFVLDLSFLGWHLLAALTFGILETFYVAPYVNGTNAALYEALKAEQNGSAVTEG